MVDMSKNQEAKAIESISSKLEWLKHLDPKVARFDDHEVEALEKDLSDLAVDFFGHGSSEFEKFHEYRICVGTWSMKDSSSEKQAKFELGIPKAVKDLEELLETIESLESSGGKKPSAGPGTDAKAEAPPKETVKTEKKKTPPNQNLNPLSPNPGLKKPRNRPGKRPRRSPGRRNPQETQTCHRLEKKPPQK
jgi:hypothetical protein